MKNFVLPLLVFSLALLQGCSVKPEPLVYGKDMCHACKMTLVDAKYGAEILTKKGKIYKFDDVNCLVNFYTSDYEERSNIQQVLVIDFATQEKLIDVNTAHFVRSESIRSPMGSGVAAFSTTEGLNSYNNQWSGELLTWDEVVQKVK
jgi:copper chaperone NosL